VVRSTSGAFREPYTFNRCTMAVLIWSRWFSDDSSSHHLLFYTHSLSWQSCDILWHQRCFQSAIHLQRCTMAVLIWLRWLSMTRRHTTFSSTHTPSHGSRVISYSTSGVFSQPDTFNRCTMVVLTFMRRSSGDSSSYHLPFYTHSLSWQSCDISRIRSTIHLGAQWPYRPVWGGYLVTCRHSSFSSTHTPSYDSRVISYGTSGAFSPPFTFNRCTMAVLTCTKWLSGDSSSHHLLFYTFLCTLPLIAMGSMLRR
jgi:hypothetical protein